MATPTTLHITPVGDGAWAVKVDESAPGTSVHPTEAQAVASAYEMVSDRGETDVIVHEPDGSIRSSVKILRPPFDRLDTRVVLEDHDEAEDAALRAEAMRITPSYARLKAGIGKYPPPPGDFDNEEMPY